MMMNCYCKDCSYRGKKSGPSGECPACGSFNLVRGDGAEEEPQRSSKFQRAALIVSWSILLIMILLKILE